MLSILIALSGVLAVTFASFGSLYTFIFGIIQVSGYIYKEGRKTPTPLG